MRSLGLHRLSGMDESSGDRIACDFSGGARLRRHGGGGRNGVEELESSPWSVGSTAGPTYWSGGGAAEPLLGGLTYALGAMVRADPRQPKDTRRGLSAVLDDPNWPNPQQEADEAPERRSVQLCSLSIA